MPQSRLDDVSEVKPHIHTYSTFTRSIFLSILVCQNDCPWKTWTAKGYGNIVHYTTHKLLSNHNFHSMINLCSYAEVGELCAFLASDKSSYITGACIEVTGELDVYMYIMCDKFDFLSLPSFYTIMIIGGAF